MELGSRVRDRITGFEGIITARIEFLTGCDRYIVQPRVDKDGKVPRSETFDEATLELMEDAPQQQEQPPAAQPVSGPTPG